MASKTQLRLSQLTGSMPSSSDSAAAANTIVGTDLSKVLDTLASAIKRIHGGSDFSSSNAGVFAQDLVPDADGSRDLGSSSAEFAEVHANNLLSQVALAITAADGDVSVTADGSDNKVVIKGDHASGVAIHLDANEGSSSEIHMEAGVIDMDATGAATLDAGGAISLTGAGVNLAGGSSEIDITTSGALDLNSGALTVDGSTVSIDGTDDSNLTVTGSAKDLDIAVAGGGTQELRLASAGTGASAIHLNASAGGINIDSADMIDIDAADEISLTTTSADGHIELVSAHTSGVAFHIDANADAASEVQIDAGILDVDITGAGTIDAGGSLGLTGAGVNIAGGSSEIDITTTGALDLNSAAFTLDASSVSIDGSGAINIDTSDTSNGVKIGAATSGMAVTIGHTTSEVTIGDNLTVTGDLTVSGVTTTLDTTNLLVEDPIVVLNKANSSANGQGGIAIENGGSSADMVFGRVANDTWGVGTKDTSGGTVTTLADMTLGAMRVGKLELDGANDAIDTDGSGTVAVGASAGILLDATTDIVLDADGDDVIFKAGSADTVGLKFSQSNSGDWTALLGTQDKDMIFSVNDGGSATEVMRLDGDVSAMLMNNDKKILFGHANHSIAGSNSSGQDLSISTGGRINVNAHIIPSSDDNSGLGVSSQRFADLFLAEGALIRMGTSAQDAYFQHSTSDRLGDDIKSSPNLANFSAFQASRIQESTITSSTTSLTFSPEIGTSISGGDIIVFQDSNGNLLAFSASSASSSATSLAVSYSSANSTSGFTSIAVSSISQTNKAHSTPSGFTDSTITSSTSGLTFSSAEIASAFANTHAPGGTTIRVDDGGGNQIDLAFSSYSSGATVSVSSATQVTGGSVSASTMRSGGSMKVVQSQKAHRVTLDGTYASLNLADHDGSSHGLMLGGTLVSATAAELNILDGDTTSASVTLQATDGFIVNDGGTMKQALISDMAAFFSSNRTKKSATLTAAVSAGGVATVSGMTHDFGADPDITDVYLNGQLMLSGSSSSNGDYRINGTGAESSLSFSGASLTSANFSSSTTSVGFDQGIGSSAAGSLTAGKIFVMENSAGTVRFEGLIASNTSSSSTSISITSGTARVFNPVTGAAVSTLAHSDVGSSGKKAADALTADDVVFFFGLEVDDVITISKNG